MPDTSSDQAPGMALYEIVQKGSGKLGPPESPAYNTIIPPLAMLTTYWEYTTIKISHRPSGGELENSVAEDSAWIGNDRDGRIGFLCQPSR